jgi:hypothetical protein
MYKGNNGNVGAVHLSERATSIIASIQGRVPGLIAATCSCISGRKEGKRLGRPPLDPKVRERISEALREPGRPGVRVIAERFGVNASTVQGISMELAGRPFGESASAA